MSTFLTTHEDKTSFVQRFQSIRELFMNLLYQYEIQNKIATLILDNTRQHNALNSELIANLITLLQSIEQNDSVRCLIISGQGKTFCSGVSLKDIDNPDWNTDTFETLITTLHQLKLPTICALNGPAYGGGAELALVCDFRIGVDNMHIRIPPASLGLHYPVSGLQRYINTLGLGPCKKLFLRAEKVTATELLNLGYLDQISEPTKLLEDAYKLAHDLKGLAPLALSGMKLTLNELSQNCINKNVLQTRVQTCLESDDLKEGLKAFKEKRPPIFLGK